MDKHLQIIKEFVEGNIGINEFETIFHSDVEIQNLLKNERIKRAYSDVDNVYDFISNQRFGSIGGALNVHGEMKRLLVKMNIGCVPSKVYEERFNLLLASQPKWLDISGDFFDNFILLKNHTMNKSELKTYLRKKILDLFKYDKKPPQWIQNPQWPIIDNEPLIFLTQLEIKESSYFHDDAMIYLFFNQKTKTIETVTQVY